MTLIDTHSHLNFAEYDSDRDEVIKKSLEKEILMINVGTNYESSRQAVEIAQNYDGVLAAIGLHPENIDYDANLQTENNQKPENIKEAEFNTDLYRELAKLSDKVVAVGETGLEYLRLPKDKARAEAIISKQQEIFKKQLALARELDFPIIIHTRLAHNDTIMILRESAGASGKIKGVVHCFSGGLAEFKEYLGLGLYIGLNGIIYKMDLDEVIKQVPLDRILLETDCPYLTPPPLTGRNEPQNVKIIAQRVAQLRGENVDTIVEISTANAKKLFGI